MSKKVKILYILLLWIPVFVNAQTTTTVAGDYKLIDIGSNGGGDFTRNLILLHEIYNGTLININNAVGTITAFRGSAGAYSRLNVVEINTTSAYNGTSASIQSFDNNNYWVLKTCLYNGKKYLALDVPYMDAYHDWGFKFAGWTKVAVSRNRGHGNALHMNAVE